MYPELKNSLLAIMLSLLALEVRAIQIVADADRDHVQVHISASEQNRLAIEGRRIASVVPSQRGVLSVQKDEALGALYFTLASTSASPGTVTLFVTDDKAVTYKLILVPRPIAGEEVILRPPVDKAARAAATQGKAASFQRRLKDLMLLMADGDTPGGAERIAVNRLVPLWKEARLVFVAKYLHGDLVGEKYRLTNISPSTMVVAEQELFRRGVLAVAVDQHTLQTGEGTDVFVARERGDE